MRRSLYLVQLLFYLNYALRRENTQNKLDGSKKGKSSKFLGRLSAIENVKLDAEEETRAPKKQRRHKSKLVKTESGENVHEPPFSAEIVDREDHDELPDFADFPPEIPEIFSVAPQELLSAKEISRMEISSKTESIQSVSGVVDKTKINETKTAKTTIASKPLILPATTVQTIVTDLPVTATLMLVPEMKLTTVTRTPTPNAQVNPDAGWVFYTPGVAQNQEKGAPTTPQPNTRGYLREGDALPDALKVISDLWNDDPIFVTEVIYITNKIMRTPGPKNAVGSSATEPTSTSTRLKKFEKRNKPTTTSAFRIHTGMLIHDQPFTIAPEDVYRGLHASAGSTLVISLVTLGLSFIITLALFA